MSWKILRTEWEFLLHTFYVHSLVVVVVEPGFIYIQLDIDQKSIYLKEVCQIVHMQVWCNISLMKIEE